MVPVPHAKVLAILVLLQLNVLGVFKAIILLIQFAHLYALIIVILVLMENLAKSAQ
jgi:hypothetical protein